MFYLNVLIAFVCIFISSAAIAELFYIYPKERSLSPAVKLGIGYVFQTVLFSAVLKFFSVEHCWQVLLAVTFSRALWLFLNQSEKLSAKRTILLIRCRLFTYRRTFALFFLAMNLFLLPLHLSHNYGPFTEGGGDITIYSDVTKLIVDHHLAVWGLDDVIFKMKKVFQSGSKIADWGDNDQSIAAFDPKKSNPPTAEYGAVRVASAERYHAIMFGSLAEWSFLAGDTNYSVYHALQAFQYATILGCIEAFFLMFSEQLAYLALFVLGGSLGIVSVFYNQYYQQEVSMMIAAVMLPLAMVFRVFSLSWWRTVGLCLAFVFIGYLHFLNILAPVAISQIHWNDFRFLSPSMLRAKMIELADFSRSVIKKPFPNSLQLFGNLVIALSLLSWLAIDWIPIFSGILPILIGALGHILHPSLVQEVSSYQGDPVRLLSLKWISFYTGLESQQHFAPFVTYPTLFIRNLLIYWTPVFIRFISLVILLLGLAKFFKSRIFSISGRLYLSGVFVFFSHSYLAKDNMYVQAKGAQNILVYFYALIILLPLTFKWSASTRKVLIAGLIGFGIVLWIPRLYFVERMAYEQDRSTILESSYFAEARRIRQEDPEALVFFEPKNSSDLYVSDQPFFGGSFLATRHLGYQRANGPNGTENRICASDFLDFSHLDHVWLLSSVQLKLGRFEWIATRLADLKKPKVLLFADQYEKPASAESSPFSSDNQYSMNHGASFVWLPNSRMIFPSALTITATPESGKNFEEFLVETKNWLKNTGNHSKLSFDKARRYIVLTEKISSSETKKMIPLFRSEGTVYFKLKIS